MLFDIVIVSGLTLSIGRSGLLGYNNGANTTGTKSLGKSRFKFKRKASFVSVVTPVKIRKKLKINV